jgi:hypothetical protein
MLLNEFVVDDFELERFRDARRHILAESSHLARHCDHGHRVSPFTADRHRPINTRRTAILHRLCAQATGW